MSSELQFSCVRPWRADTWAVPCLSTTTWTQGFAFTSVFSAYCCELVWSLWVCGIGALRQALVSFSALAICDMFPQARVVPVCAPHHVHFGALSCFWVVVIVSYGTSLKIIGALLFGVCVGVFPLQWLLRLVLPCSHRGPSVFSERVATLLWGHWACHMPWFTRSPVNSLHLLFHSKEFTAASW